MVTPILEEGKASEDNSSQVSHSKSFKDIKSTYPHKKHKVILPLSFLTLYRRDKPS